MHYKSVLYPYENTGHFARLANRLKDEESARDYHVFACNFAKYLPIKKDTRVGDDLSAARMLVRTDTAAVFQWPTQSPNIISLPLNNSFKLCSVFYRGIGQRRFHPHALGEALHPGQYLTHQFLQ